ncbi:MAG: ABC transporter permease [Proteobacteria bacterium]|nr:ABC transporter permease [Pseudomonadota bacterium]
MISLARLGAFTYKESLQAIRDPSTLIIAVILPALMMFLFAYGVSLDTNNIRIGLVLEDTTPQAISLAKAFESTPYFNVKSDTTRNILTEELVAGKIRGIVVIPQDFSAKLLRNQTSPVQVIADGTETNTASFVQNYANGVVQNWTISQLLQSGLDIPSINVEPRIWFNPELKSRNVILPGSIAIIMALIGTLLTALVVAREWERGSMEAILSTPIHISELIIGKVAPYFILGMISMILCVSICVFFFKVPFVGSILLLSVSTGLFLLAGLSQGLLISTLSKNQFVASQAAINAAFLPAYMLSGFLYEIQSMPAPIKAITYLLPARYFVSIIQTSFLAGVVWSELLPNMFAMLVIASFFLYMVSKKSKKSLE